MIKEAVEVLKKGGVVLYPTDTLYGLGVDYENKQAVEKLRNLKGGKRMSVIVSDIEMAKKYVEIDERTEKIIQEFLPGKLTLILPKIGGGNLGVRIPNNDIALNLVKALGRPITSTSANKTGEPTKFSVEDILKDIEVDYVLDGGVLKDHASTIIDLTGEDIKILREGAITKEQLEGINNK